MTNVTATTRQFFGSGPIQANWPAAKCEVSILPGYKVVRGSAFMEYEFQQVPTGQVQMLRWKPRARIKRKDLGGEDDLLSLGVLAEADDQEIIKWVSENGLLGFRNVGRITPQQLGLTYWINPGTDRFHGWDHQYGLAYEPLGLFKEGARVARAIAGLYLALKQKDEADRSSAIEGMVAINTAVRVNREMEMQVIGVPARSFFRKPQRASQWIDLGHELLADLIDCYLGNEFRLHWTGPKSVKGALTCGWKVRSHMSALLLKLASRVRESRFCVICDVRLSSNLRSDAKTCSHKCRKELSRSSA